MLPQMPGGLGPALVAGLFGLLAKIGRDAKVLEHTALLQTADECSPMLKTLYRAKGWNRTFLPAVPVSCWQWKTWRRVQTRNSPPAVYSTNSASHHLLPADPGAVMSLLR